MSASIHRTKDILQPLDDLETLTDVKRTDLHDDSSSRRHMQMSCHNLNFVFHQQDAVALDLMDKTHFLIHTGKLVQHSDGFFKWSKWNEMSVILFDHCLILSREKERNGIVRHHVIERPIPLDLLDLDNFTDLPMRRKSGLVKFYLTGGQQEHAGSALQELFPCTLRRRGRHRGLLQFYATSAESRAEWRQKLEEAIDLHTAVQEAKKIFEINILSADTFRASSIKVTTSSPFLGPGNAPHIAIGCSEGLWTGLRHDPRSMRRVLALKEVRQCTMLEEFGICLVLADKSLLAYNIEDLLPSLVHGVKTPQKLSGGVDVQFFSVGKLGGQALVIYMYKNESACLFHVLQLLQRKTENAPAPSQLGVGDLSFERAIRFRHYKEFRMRRQALGIIFLKKQIAVSHSSGFILTDLNSFRDMDFPVLRPSWDRKCNEWFGRRRLLGMFLVGKEILLCFEEYGVYLSRRSRGHWGVAALNKLYWEGRAKRVAFHPPFVLLFSSDFIEIRYAASGRLAQIIPGEEIRCLWRRRGPDTTGIEGSLDKLEPLAHGVMKVRLAALPSTRDGRQRDVAQYVFELLPTPHYASFYL